MAETMKNTGIEWIGKIPEEWEIKRFKYLHNGTNVGESIDKEYWSQDKSDFVFYTAGETNIYNTYTKFPSWKYVKQQDLLLARNGTPYVYLPPINAQYSDHIIRTKIKNDYDKRFIRYCLKLSIENEKVEVVSLATWSVSIWNEQEIPLPSISEQTKIADFLDKQTSKIDAIIKTNEEQLEVLKKYKKSLITQTVTKGMNKNAKMKDSGIDWIGQIPEGWEMQRMKYILVKENPIRVGPFGTALTTSDYTDDGKWVYNQRVVLDKNFLENDTFISEQKARELKGFKVYPNDILITTRGTIGKVAKVPVNCPEGVLHPCIIRFRVDEKKLPYSLIDFLFNQSDFILEQITRYSNATTIDVIYSETLKNLIVPIIPQTELKEIIDFLSEKCTKIDSLITQKQQAIDTMQKYKKSLIYEYVTGKKRIK